ncbi:MAG: polyprenyl synthetase family protein [Paludibacteraceae bacterium]|nr:polyprenyl synthetase family protein [Paludibacteraceae bacterium]
MDINSVIEQLDWHREPLGLYEPIGYTLAAGGKRLRPTLCVIGAQIFGGAEETVLPAALALEIFHNFTLLHDDVMDKAEVRRGRACVHIRWNENTAILSGDQMMIEAYKQLGKVDEKHLPYVLRLFNQMATEICEGQQYDVDFEQREDVSIGDYMQMIRLKTSVLLATALRIGAYIGGATEEEQKALYEYGICIGLAFQIQDDYLDCYGNPKTFGKAIGGDIREGKKTWLWLTAQQERGDKEALASKDYDRVINEYNRLGVPELALQQIRQLTEEGLSYLNQVPQGEATDRLRRLADQLVNRQS